MTNPLARPVHADVLTTRIIPNLEPALGRALGIESEQTSIGLITATLDDALFVAIDEATKHAAVEVVYARSFYAGSGYPSGPLSGEAIGVLAGADPAAIAAGLEACIQHLKNDACFYAVEPQPHPSQTPTDPIQYFPHVVSRCGSYLAREVGVPEGTALAYLIAPPVEAIVGLDAAAKAANVTLQQFYGPPTETNFAGAILAGQREACQAAADAFERAVIDVATRPTQIGDGR